jgi:photosystem II stability/assembly factor-like uncharacterized protein
MKKFSALLLVLFITCLAASAQRASVPPETLLDRLTFRSIGPATMGGRVDDFAVFERQPSIFYVGTATGGVWKTVNNGTTWETVFDRQDIASIGAVAVASDNPNLVWVGTGEDNNRQSSSWGTGVYKSIDGGRTWKNMGLAESRQIGRIVIDPLDHDTVYVAATGHLWGPNKERGLFKTTDGGATWTTSLVVDENTGATDVVMDPSNNKILYAAMYQRQRAVWGFNGGGPGSGLYKTTDGGANWSKLTEGIPAGPLGRIGIDIYRKDPKTVVALIQNERDSGLYRSEDAGTHWTKVSGTDPRPIYFSQIRIDPNDSRRMYILGTRVMVSDNSGRTFAEVRLKYTRPAGDRPRDDMDAHALWIDPRDSGHLLLGADVGVATSYDRGGSWDYIDNMVLGQFYHVGYDMDAPYHVYGGLQDNDVWSGPSAVRNRFGISNHEWTTLTIGDGFVAVADPHDSHTIYGETQDGNIVRVNRDSNERRSIRPQAAAGEPPLRWAWDTPMIVSPHDSNTILIGANRVYRSTDRGDSWQAISPDLTTGADRETLSLMGVAGKDIKLSKNDGVSAWPTLISLVESPKKAGLYYAGADDGAVHVSRDAGKTWTDISARFPGLPKGVSGSRFAPSQFDEKVAYAVFNNHRADDYNPYVFVTEDYGNTWKSLAAALTAGQVVNCITEDSKNPNVLYLGTETGLYVSLDRGQHWVRFQSNLPTVPIDEITIHPRDNDLLLATHGRSIWILDDLTPIQHAAEAARMSAYLFEIRPAFEFVMSYDRANYPGDRRFWGQNPEFGAGISFFLDEAPKDIRIAITDSSGTTIREYANDDLKNSRNAGLNRMYWDLRHQPIAASAAPLVLPGDYQVNLTVEGRPVGTQTVHVMGDPAVKISEADRKSQHDTALALHRLQATSIEAATTATVASDEVRALQDALNRLSSPPAGLSSSAEALSQRITRLTTSFGIGRQPGGGPGSPSIGTQITNLKNQIMGWTAAPTSGQSAQARDIRTELAKLVDDLNDITSNAIPTLFKTLSDNDAHPVELKTIAPVKIAPFE